MLCLVKPVNARFFCLLNSVKYDSSLFSFSAPWQVNSFFISANYLFYAVTVFSFFLKKKIFLALQFQFRIFQNYFSYAATVFFLPEFILHMYSVEGYVVVHRREDVPVRLGPSTHAWCSSHPKTRRMNLVDCVLLRPQRVSPC